MTSWLEKHIGFIAIPNLVRGMALMQGLAWVLNLFNPTAPGTSGFYEYLALDPQRVLSGEIWRLVTFIFIPGTQNALFLIIAIFFLMFIGEGLEQGMGSFRVTIFVLLGMVAQIFFAFIWGWPATGIYLTAALVMAFATLYPDQVIHLFLVLPLRIKWIGFFTAAWVLYDFLRFPLAGKVIILAMFLNYGLFFGVPFFRRLKWEREARLRKQTFLKAQQAQAGEDGAFHRCVICGATELSHPERDFRVAADGKEYCNLHLPGASQP